MMWEEGVTVNAAGVPRRLLAPITLKDRMKSEMKVYGSFRYHPASTHVSGTNTMERESRTPARA
eukprot:1694942-Amphidinium_carterae.2